jgi:hypothetical protein
MQTAGESCRGPIIPGPRKGRVKGGNTAHTKGHQQRHGFADTSRQYGGTLPRPISIGYVPEREKEKEKATLNPTERCHSLELEFWPEMLPRRFVPIPRPASCQLRTRETSKLHPISDISSHGTTPPSQIQRRKAASFL